METIDNTNNFTTNFSTSPLTVGDYSYTFARQGWQCPLCGRVYSPDTMMCPYCCQTEIVTTTNFDETEDFFTAHRNVLQEQNAVKMFLMRKDKKKIMEAMNFPYNGGETLETNMTAFIKRMTLNDELTKLYDYLMANKE